MPPQEILGEELINIYPANKTEVQGPSKATYLSLSKKYLRKVVIYNLCYKSQIKSHSPPPALNGAVLDASTQALSINLAGTYAAAIFFLTIMHSKQDGQNRLL